MKPLRSKMSDSKDIDSRDSSEDLYLDQANNNQADNNDQTEETNNDQEKTDCPEPVPTFRPCEHTPEPRTETRTDPKSDLSKYIDMLLPILTSYLTNSMGSGFSYNPKPCPAEELIKEFNNIWEGLDQIANDRVRAICFMDRMNKFHEKLWSYAKSNSKTNNTFSNSALSQTSDKWRREISNVMVQLTK